MAPMGKKAATVATQTEVPNTSVGIQIVVNDIEMARQMIENKTDKK